MDPMNDLCSIFFKALERVDPYSMIKDAMKIQGDILTIDSVHGRLHEDLKSYRSIIVLGMGKASIKMAQAVEEILKERVTQGAVITRVGQAEDLKRIRVMEAGHPIPDERSIRGAEVLFELAMKADEKTLIINLVSGGGSALFSLPREGITLTDLQDATRTLLECGAAIQEVNCIRKHISRVKGGQFARIAHPARMINLILSDVVGDRPETIASGITAADDTTYAQALRIAERYRIRDRLPASVIALLESGKKGSIPETPKLGDPVFERVTNIILGNNTQACRTARDYGETLGYHAYFITSSLTGEAREVAKFFSALAKDMLRNASDFSKPALIVAGGETTVTVRGKGRGGRNQEMALSFLIDFLENKGMEGVCFLSAGTDGNDGPTDATGAIVTPEVYKAAVESGMDAGQYLAENDSYGFFKQAGGLFITGPTNTNVCDIQLLSVI